MYLKMCIKYSKIDYLNVPDTVVKSFNARLDKLILFVVANQVR